MIFDDFNQSQFIVYELVLPYCTVCTPVKGQNKAWHTPRACEESSDSEYSLWFTNNKAPLMAPPKPSINIKSRLNSSVWHVVTSGGETTPTLKAGEGMASRGTMTISMTDFEGDSGPIEFSDTGTFFGKLKARNVLDGKKIISHYYSIVDGSKAKKVGTSTHFITKATLTSGKFTITAKDALKDLEAFSQKFPIPTEASLTADIDSNTTTIPVTNGGLYSANKIIIIDSELMYITSVSGNKLNVITRGSGVSHSDSETIYKTLKAQHSQGSTVQICYKMVGRYLAHVLSDIFYGVGLDKYVDFTQWYNEITEWNYNSFLYGVIHEPTSADELINKLLSSYMIDMWLDQPSQKVRVSASTTWKNSIRTLTEDTDLSNLKTSTDADSRFSRAYIYNDKDYQAENDDSTNYSRLTLHKDTASEHSDFYGSVKVKALRSSPLISPSSAEILVSRFVQRFSKTPETLTFTMEESKLSGTGLGDIVDIITTDSQTMSGETLQARVRAQIINIKPDLNKIGRTYSIKALSYIPLIASSGGGGDGGGGGGGNAEITIFISGSVYDLNLFSRAGAPPAPIDITFVFDAVTIGSTEIETPAIRAGWFAAGSTIKLIFTNGSKVSAIGGAGGNVYVGLNVPLANSISDPTVGGVTYQSDDIETKIYLNYGTVDTYDTSCEMYAAGGGGGSAIGCIRMQVSLPDMGIIYTGSSGGGGNGIPEGKAGTFVNKDYWNGSRVSNSGDDGGFYYGGSGVSGAADMGNSGNAVRCKSTSGAGAFSDKGDDGAGSAVGSTAPVVLTTIGALAGASIKGANVTVYNKSSSASKFTVGNSDSFTLIQ